VNQPSAHLSRKLNPNEAYYYARTRLQEANSTESSVALTTRVKNSLEKTLKNNRRPAASVRLALWEQRQKQYALMKRSTSYTPHILEAQKSQE